MEKDKKGTIIKPSITLFQLGINVKNLIRLLDQGLYWFCERILAIQAGDWSRTAYIEESYLIPLQRKIGQLAERGAKT